MTDIGQHRRPGRPWPTPVLAMAAGLAAVVVVTGPGVAAERATATRPAGSQPASADPPRESGDRAERGEGRARGMRGAGGFGGGPPGWGRRLFAPQPDADPAQAIQFMSEHAPQYWRWVSGVNFPEDRRKGIEATVAAAYATYQRLRPDDPELYNVIVQRVEVEDRLFGLRMKVRQSPVAPHDPIVTEVRAELSASSDLIFKERKLRLARLKRTVEKEEKQLVADDANRNDVINRRLDAILNGGGNGGGWGGMPFPGGPGFRGDGRGQPTEGGSSPPEPPASR